MTQTTQTSIAADWRLFMRRHWGALAAFIAAAALAVAGAVYVFVWFTGNIQAIGFVPSTLSLWSMSDVVIFMVHAIFWELVLIGIPVAVGAVIGWHWWRRLPETEKRLYRNPNKSHKSRDAGGAISPLLFIAFALKVYLDGNWGQPISTWTVDYVVSSMVTILIWIVTILAIPAAIALVVWLSRAKTQQP